MPAGKDVKMHVIDRLTAVGAGIDHKTKAFRAAEFCSELRSELDQARRRARRLLTLPR